jgi:hypothetical protein
MPRITSLSFLSLGLSLAMWSPSADAQWHPDGAPVCTAPGSQIPNAAVTDGAGGAIVAWYDSRGGNDTDIYVQHVLASGAVDPIWPADGRALCTAIGPQWPPVMVSDGAGGAIVAWHDYRAGNLSGLSDLYAQHVLASGVVDPAWPLDGCALSTAPGDQSYPLIVGDGAGGAIVTWRDSRNVYGDVYAQHVLASGMVDPAWPADGLAVCTARDGQAPRSIVADGAGGAIVAWADLRNGDADVYAQHVLAAGVVDPAWPTDGRALCGGESEQAVPAMAADGAGGAFVVWTDAHVGPDGYYVGTYDLYAQHVLASGELDPTWPPSGLPVCTANEDQLGAQIIADDRGGAIVAWYDLRRDDRGDIYAQRILASGAADPDWPANGLAICTAPAAGGRGGAAIVSDGMGGAILVWGDYRTTSQDIYAHHVSGSGVLDPDWPIDGRALCSADGDQNSALIVDVAAGRSIVFWRDYSGADVDIYAQELGPSDPTPVTVSLVSADVGPGSVRLTWYGADGVSLVATVERRTEAGGWERLGEIGVDGNGLLLYEDRAITAGTRYAYRLSYAQGVEQFYTAEVWVEVPALRFALLGLTPNPSTSNAVVRFVLPSGAEAMLELFDLNGRLIVSRDVGSLGAGAHEVNLSPRARLPAGVYAIRLRQGAQVATSRAAIIR